MSLGTDERTTPALPGELAQRGPVGLTARLVRLWSLPLRVHAVALFVVLVALLPFVGSSGIFSADEGAAIIQARQLARGDGWIAPYAFTSIDAKQTAFPLEYADPGHDGFAPYAKHPLYPVVLAGADRIGGVTAMFVLSIIGTVVAAFFGALLAMQWSPGVARPTLWVVGLGSPLLFDSYLVIAHALGAAAATIAVWSALRYLDEARVRWLVVTIAAVALAVSLRSEASLFAVALGGVLFVSAGVGRTRRPAILGGFVVAAAAVVRLAEPRVVRWLLGASTVTSHPSSIATHGLLDDRWHAFVTTWLSPAYGSASSGQAFLVMIAVVVALAALCARRRPQDSSVVVLLSAFGVACSVVVLTSGAQPVPGLLVVFPVLVAGLVSLRRTVLAESTPRVLLATWVLFSLGVLATQYRVGGNGEWGGRYFALCVPLVVPVALDALRVSGLLVASSTRRVAVVALVVTTAAVSFAAVREVRASHQRADAEASSVNRISAATRPGDGGQPVIVTSEAVFPRTAWKMFTERRMAMPPRNRMPEYLGRLRRAGILELTFVTRDPQLHLEQLSTSYRVEHVVSLGRGTDWRFAVLRAK